MAGKCVGLALLCVAMITIAFGADSLSKPSTQKTEAANAAYYLRLDFSDRSEFENATRGLIELKENVVINKDGGSVVWSLQASDYTGEAPSTTNPSLWRNTQLNAYAGLFEVCEGIYQVRGYDPANVTFIRTDTGWVVFDVLMCMESMAAALKLMESHFGTIDVKAVLYSHPHIDHFGGIEGLLTKEQVADSSLSLEDQLASGKIPILAPEGFMEHAVSEYIYAGKAMGRRSQYQYGMLLDQGALGRLSIGIGMGMSIGTIGLFAPTYEINEKNSHIWIDGLEIEFQLAPGTEAPVEMNAYFPRYRALWMAELCSGTMHNLYTLRGTEVRDAKAWAFYLLEAEQLFCDRTDVVFQSHNWPRWGDEVREYLTNTAAIYKFIHDQTLHYINLGYTSTEIANMIQLPEKLDTVWYTRQNYGTLSHNVKAVYQKYMGWYDGNPVNLNLLPPQQTAKKWVAYLGDVDRVLAMARKDFEAGEYQWVAQITKELIYADPGNQAARELCADALEQLGYQAESGAWRNAYLTGALELRAGNRSIGAITTTGLLGNLLDMTVEMVFDYIAVLTDAIKAQHDELSMNLIVTDTQETFFVHRKNGVLLIYPGETRQSAQATIRCTKLQLFSVLKANPAQGITIEGDQMILQRLIQYATVFDGMFNMIEPLQ